jgi:Ser/Thr protein kinase RdoA (MazF antagonist)
MLGTLASIEPLPSGSGGQSWLLATANGRFVAKIFSADSLVLLGPSAQFHLMRQLAGAGIAPAPAGFSNAERLLVTEYVEAAAAVAAAALTEPERIGEVVQLLHKLHATDSSIPAFSPTAYAQDYLAAIGGRAGLSGRDRERLDELFELAAVPIAGRACLCHNDLTADNILFGAIPRLIDFDYACTATPIVDLASLAFMNEFTADQAGALLESYFGGRVPLPWAEFSRTRRIVRLLAHFWSLAATEAGADIVAQYRIDDD